MSEDYSNERTRVYTLKLRALLEDLPPICAEFFRGIEPSTSVLTRYGYALDLKLFFKFLISDSLCSGLLSIRDIDCSILEKRFNRSHRTLPRIRCYVSCGNRF